MVLYGWAITQVIKIRVNRAVLVAASHAVQVEAGHAPALGGDWWWLMQQIKELDQTWKTEKACERFAFTSLAEKLGSGLLGPNGGVGNQ